MKAHLRLTENQQALTTKEIRRLQVENQRIYSKAVDAFWLLAIHDVFKAGKQRLELSWEVAVEKLAEYREHYLMGNDEIGFVAQDHLKKLGVDLDELYRRL